MRRALLMIVFSTAVLAVPAHASVQQLPARLPVQAGSSPAVASADYHAATALTPATGASESSQIVQAAYPGRERVDGLAVMSPAASPAERPVDSENSGWRYAATLLGTLGLIGTIAFRRQKAGKPSA